MKLQRNAGERGSEIPDFASFVRLPASPIQLRAFAFQLFNFFRRQTRQAGHLAWIKTGFEHVLGNFQGLNVGAFFDAFFHRGMGSQGMGSQGMGSKEWGQVLFFANQPQRNGVRSCLLQISRAGNAKALMQDLTPSLQI